VHIVERLCNMGILLSVIITCHSSRAVCDCLYQGRGAESAL
jgi:hypothetical protein